MPKVRAIVAGLEDAEGPIAIDEVVDVSDEQAAAWQAAGKISMVELEERNAATAINYGDVVGRDDIASTPITEEVEEPKSKKGRK